MYATQSDMIEAYGEDELIQLTDRAGSAGAIVPEVLEAALSDASDLIESYAAQAYAVPLTPCPAVVRRYACDIARYYLHKDAAPEIVKDNYLAALKWLKDLSAGNVTLVGLASAPEEYSGQSAETAGPARVFNRESLKGF